MTQHTIEAPVSDIKCYIKQFEILYFFSRNPEATFGVVSSTGELQSTKPELCEALNELIERGIIKQDQNYDGLKTYRLSDQKSHQYIKNMQILMKYLKKHQSEVESVSRTESGNARPQLK
jgi:hypothetical protein